MEKNKTKKEKMPFYKKVIGVSIMVAVAIYCIPELQEKVCNVLDLIKNGRKQR